MNNRSNKTHIKRSLRQEKKNKSIIKGGIIVLLIASTPFLFYIHESFPAHTQSWETSLFTFTTQYPSLYSYAWFLTGKIIPIILLLIWFITCKHWWNWIILAPLAMYVFQLWGVVNHSRSIDEVELIYLLPLLIVLIPAVYLVRAKLFYEIREADLKTFEEELSQKRGIWHQIKELFR